MILLLGKNNCRPLNCLPLFDRVIMKRNADECGFSRRRKSERKRKGRSASGFVFSSLLSLAFLFLFSFAGVEAQIATATATVGSEEEETFAVKSYVNGTVAVVSKTEILIDASVVRVPSDVYIAALEDDSLDLTGDVGYDLDKVEAQLTKLSDTLANVKLLSASDAGNVQCNRDGTKEMRFDFESKAFDATHCVCKDQFVGDLCETAVGALPGDYTDFIAAVNECLTVDPVHGICPDSAFGVMSDWDVSLVSNFAEAFKSRSTFNANITGWDTRSVVDFTGTFESCQAFNQDLSRWSTSTATSMSRMFFSATEFDSDLSGWDTSKVAKLDYSFAYASKFKGVGLSNWNTAKVTTLEGTFYGAAVFDENISSWTTTKVKNMNLTFATYYGGAHAFNQPIGTWDTSSVTAMETTFYSNPNFNQNLKWNTSLVESMYGMFGYASKFNGELATNEALGYWGTGSVKDFSTMFARSSFNQDISGWDTSSAEDMSYMFSGVSSFNQDLSKWDVSKVTTFKSTFNDCQNLDTDLSQWDVSSVMSFQQTFTKAYLMNSDMSLWNTAEVTSMYGMFAYARTFNSPIINWDVSKVTDMRYMFYGALAFQQDISSWTGTAATTAQSNMFFGATAFEANFACDDAVSGPASSCDVRPMDQMPWSGTVNNGEVTLNGDAKSDYTVYVWHADVHTGGYAYVQFHYADGVVDEIRHTGNGSRKFLKSDGTWTGWFTVGSHGTTLRTQLGLVKYYDIDCTQVAGTSTWYFTTSSGSVSKIDLKEDSNWGGMKSVEVYRES
jgi:surface protein